MKKLFKLIRKIDLFFYNSLYSQNSNILIIFFSKIGNFISILFFIIIMFILPFYITKKIALISLLSLFFSTIVVFILKYSLKRKRIYNDNNLKSKIDPYSFPSGHISRLSSLIFPCLYILPLFFIFFILSFLISILRIKKGYHYFTDCVVGFVIGLLSGVLGLYTFYILSKINIFQIFK